MARHTQQRIADALKRLMDRKELDKITVQDVADEADVNYKTFYYHFHGISDLIRWMYSVAFFETIGVEDVNQDNWAGLIRRFTEAVRADSRYISAIYNSKYGADFRLSVVRMFDRATVRYIRSAAAEYERQFGAAPRLTQVQMKYIVSYHANALYGMIETWFIRGMTDSVDKLIGLIGIINVLTNDSLFAAFHTVVRAGDTAAE